ncbi:MAG: carboxypeptidase-like regulatory domain-containing protein [Bacteroidota bacterium]
MRRLALPLALFALALPTLAQPTSATLTGTVTGDDGQPLPGAHVFLAQTQRGTITNAEGRYRLPAVPLGAHRLVASIIGFETDAEDLVLRDAGDTKTINFRLRESEFELGEVTVESTEDARWQARYERFQHRFLGESSNAAETEILNPYVLDFDERMGTLTATAREPLIIENRALGYRVRYDLTDFEARSNSNFFNGEPLFEEMEPADEVQFARWQANRRKAYFGSPRHLIRSLIADTAEEQDFTLYLLPARGPGGQGGLGGFGNQQRPGNRFPTTAGEVLKPAKNDEYKLTFFGVLEASYLAEGEAAEYLGSEWNPEQRTARPVQTSQLRFPMAEDTAKLDRFGEELDARSIVVSGYMAFERFADDLPREYGLAESGIPGAAEAVEASLSEAERVVPDVE